MALDVNVLGQIDTHPPTWAYLNYLLDTGDRCDRTPKPVSDATTLTTARGLARSERIAFFRKLLVCRHH